MLKYWPFYAMLILVISGAVYIHRRDVVLGLSLTAAGVLIVWTWAYWPDIRNWFKNHKKGH